jgi:predicted nucleic acid-binding Zn ribbon protein
VDSGPNRTADTPPETDLARAVTRGSRAAGRAGRRRSGPPGEVGRGPGGYSGPAPDDTDPQRVGELFTGYAEERGWERPLSEARIFADWAAVVGADVAAHSTPVALTAGELRIAAESTAWATQLRLLTGTLLARLAAELGPEVVSRISVSGPTGPSWKHGGYSVRGARGPRDTYG